MIITKLVGLLTLWFDIEKRARSWTQYKYRKRSACHMRGASVGIYAHAWAGLSLLTNKEKPHNLHLFRDDQSIV